MSFCQNCGKELPDQAKKCPECGADAAGNVRNDITLEELPKRFRPLGAWAYFGWSLLFSIPVVGLILLIVFSTGAARNINLRRFARSHFCMLLFIFIVIAAVLIVGAATGSWLTFTQWLARPTRF